MREILNSVNSQSKENPKVDVVITRAGISLSCYGKHLYRMKLTDILSQVEDSWFNREYDNLYFTYKGEDYFISDSQIEVLCEVQQGLQEDCHIGKINTFNREEIALISKTSPMIKGFKSKTMSKVVRAVSVAFAARMRYLRAI